MPKYERTARRIQFYDKVVGEVQALPPGEVVLSSGPLDGPLLPPDTAAWLV